MPNGCATRRPFQAIERNISLLDRHWKVTQPRKIYGRENSSRMIFHRKVKKVAKEKEGIHRIGLDRDPRNSNSFRILVGMRARARTHIRIEKSSLF